MNDKLKGFRGLLTILGTWAMIFVDTFTTQITSLSPEALKASFIITGPITVKLIWTEVRPKIMGWLKNDPKV